ncbi:hypothetical protein [Paenibacillus sp. CGMCC 1.18879]|uniref:hypothetical protein n=1 Tax=Paenibacillus sp. CGMCC 1.18879 TaxID=2834466 RepID=UPI001CAA0DBF|nr:hypothetical protein [Paenibacillus sp. CGMCC 1.18879]MBY9082619.1 hypothetical protein [Paenibacillus sp. CGMCC 1.18879]
MDEYFGVGLILRLATEHMLLISPALLLICGLLFAEGMTDTLFKIIKTVRRTIRL